CRLPRCHAAARFPLATRRGDAAPGQPGAAQRARRGAGRGAARGGGRGGGRRVGALCGRDRERRSVLLGRGPRRAARRRGGLRAAAGDGGAPSVLARREMLGAYYRTFLDVRALDVPTVAAVNGPAIGAGLNLALCCDLRVAAESARFGATFVRLGIHPGGGA